MKNKKLNLAVVAGGDSGEYEISIRSAAVVIENLNHQTYNKFLIHIKGSSWTFINQNNEECQVDKTDFSIVVNNEKIKFDCVFIVIHGTPGEDGKLQGYFDMLHLPYTSCGSITSALTFNKSFCNKVVAAFGVNTAPSVHLFRHTLIDAEAILETVGLPCFVKPNCGGSSVGMTKVKETSGLLPAIEKAFVEDQEVLIEAFVKGREITCGVFRHEKQIVTLPIVEIVSKKEFFDFEAKYNPELAEEILPAPIPEAIDKQCKEISSMLYDKLGCKGVVRFDYLFNDTNINFLEVNTVPGLSAESIVPKMARFAGFTMSGFYDVLIREALSQANCQLF